MCRYLATYQLPHCLSFFSCRYAAVQAEPGDPCNPSPCGPNSQCRQVNGQGVCSCLPNYIGSPPGCRPECVVSSECPQNRACLNQKCVDPCPGPCGLNTRCEVINHSPICSCRQGFTGDPFSRCFAIPRKPSQHYCLAEKSLSPSCVRDAYVFRGFIGSS
jgi:hypothetical protein